ncbi:MAG TPA: alkaline phosphatase [Bacteroidales bacterium]|nr:alkaline phosphatase [Bacteroidales bacterium]
MKTNKIFFKISLTILLLVFGFVSSSFTPENNEPSSVAPRVKNIILLIGDGMGITHISGLMSVSGHNLNMTTAKHIGFTQTHSYDNYVTDSAASGTAIASGKKTKNGMIGMDPDSNNVVLITEKVRKQKKMSFGVVSTSAVTHATPASFVAHNISRNDYEGIALDFVRTQPDVFIGGGKANFMNRRDQRDLIKVLERNDYEVVYTMEELKNADGEKVAGLLADEHMPRFSEGRDYMLAEATYKAIELLSRNDRGFFLMVEASQIDWGGHSNDAQYILEEAYDLDVALGVALTFALNDRNTLVLLTADHETGGMSLTGGNIEEKSIIAKFTTTTHTGVIVPVFAFGAGAEYFTGFYDNTELNEKMCEVLRLR